MTTLAVWMSAAVLGGIALAVHYLPLLAAAVTP